MKTLIADIMSTNLIKVRPSDSLKKVDDLFLSHQIHHILVAEGNHLEGIISIVNLKDLKRGRRVELTGYEALENKSLLDNFSARSIMTYFPVTVKASDSLKIVADLFLENNFHAAPVLDKDENLVGIITVYNLIKHAYS